MYSPPLLPNGPSGAHIYAVLIKSRFFDLFGESCALLAGAVPLLGLISLTHLEYCRRVTRRTREQRRTKRIIENLLRNLHVGRFADVKRMKEAGGGGSSSEGGGGGESSSSSGAAAASGDAEGGSSSSSSGQQQLAVWQAESSDCPICMEEWSPEDEVVFLPCQHLLHKECLLSWARTCARGHHGRAAIATCPLCKAALADGSVPAGEEGCRCCPGLQGVYMV